ncbi:hydantoinase/oxoprolinase family protein [Pirellulales bacterium]|nr:hydantoinase/oxoprolinase family protein [Pirellulales bacterium]
MTWLAFDIGGANLKASDGRDYSVASSFPLWKKPKSLSAALREAIDAAPANGRLAVTMTGELADCFASRSEGVEFILNAVEQAAGHSDAYVYRIDRSLGPIDDRLRGNWLAAAATNWHVLATYAARFCDGAPGVLIDVGSTTVDIIPIVDGHPAARGATDVDRLMHGELVYTGVERSPVCAVVDALPYRGRNVPVAQELFATVLDAYLLTGERAERHDCGETADHGPQTKDAARRRLGRMLCTELTFDEAFAAAESIRRAQLGRLRHAWRNATSNRVAPPQCAVISGQGEFLARQLLEECESKLPVVSLHEQLGPTASRCAPAFALAVLARERFGA